MKTTCALVLSTCSLVAACDKGAGASGAGGAGAASSPATAAEPDCEGVVDKMASLNPPDMRGEAEKKLWKKMCAQMKATEKACVVASKTMDEMEKCLPADRK